VKPLRSLRIAAAWIAISPLALGRSDEAADPAEVDPLEDVVRDDAAGTDAEARDDAPAADGPLGTWNGVGDRAPRLTLNDDGRLTGTDGCNRLMGGWGLDGDVIRFEQVASTMMCCEGVDEWLKRLDTARVDDASLIVYDAAGAEIGILTRA